MASPIAALRRETRPMEDSRAASALWRRPPAGSTGGPAPPLAYSAASRRADVNNSGFIAKFHVKVIKLGQNIIWKSLFLLDVRLFRALGPAAALRCIRCTCRLVPHAVWRGQGDAACRYCGTGGRIDIPRPERSSALHLHEPRRCPDHVGVTAPLAPPASRQALRGLTSRMSDSSRVVVQSHA